MLRTRRSLCGALVSFVAAPAIARASSLMPVKAVPDLAGPIFVEHIRAWSGIVWIERTPPDPNDGCCRRVLEPLTSDACLWPETDYEDIASYA
jgi:hypothetical protein